MQKYFKIKMHLILNAQTWYIISEHEVIYIPPHPTFKSWCHGKGTNTLYASQELGGLGLRSSAFTEVIESPLECQRKNLPSLAAWNGMDRNNFEILQTVQIPIFSADLSQIPILYVA